MARKLKPVHPGEISIDVLVHNLNERQQFSHGQIGLHLKVASKCTTVRYP